MGRPVAMWAGTLHCSQRLMITVPAPTHRHEEGGLALRLPNLTRWRLPALLLAVAGCGAAPTSQTSGKPTVRIVAPVNTLKKTASVSGSVSVTVRLSIANFTLLWPGESGAVGSGQMDLYENGKLLAQMTTTSYPLRLQPGTYTLKAVLVTNGKTVASSTPTVVSVVPGPTFISSIEPPGPLSPPSPALAQTPELGAVAMLTSSVAVAGGNGVLLRTTNDGVSWKPVAYPSGRVSSLDRATAQEVFAIAGQGALYRSTDVGQTWQRMKGSAPVQTVSFLTARLGLAIEAGGGAGQLLETTNAGVTWEPVNPSILASWLCFTSATQGFALGQGQHPNLYVRPMLAQPGSPSVPSLPSMAKAIWLAPTRQYGWRV